MNLRSLPKSLMATVLATASLFSNSAHAAEVKAVDFSLLAYMRAATGVNSKGGKQTCFTNPGSVANEFRLGNECGIYGETGFRANLLKSPGLDDPYFFSQFTLAYSPAADSQYEDTDIDPDRRDIQVIEAFVEGGNFDGVKMGYWAGKRFYRSVDVNMNDFYYFSSMSGIGAGLNNIRTSVGTASAAILRESELVTTTAPAAVNRLDSTNGVLGKTALDLRLDRVPLSSQDFLYLWGVGAYTPPGYVAATNATYEAGRGYAAGVRYRHQFGAPIAGAAVGAATPASTNDFAIVYGTGVMQTLEMNGASALDGAGVNNASRLRLVEHFIWKATSRFESAFAATYEDRNSGAQTDAKSTWWNVGVRPAYFFNDHFSVVGELGHSEVRDEADRAANGVDRIGARQLTRVTIAPQVGLAPGLFARPVIRLFVSYSMWNDDNRQFLASGTTSKSVASSLAAFAAETRGTSIGVQSEVWF